MLRRFILDLLGTKSIFESVPFPVLLPVIFPWRAEYIDGPARGFIGIASMLHIGGQIAHVSLAEANNLILDDLIDFPLQHDHELFLRMAMAREMGMRGDLDEGEHQLLPE
jgi:hypothetical protein